MERSGRSEENITGVITHTVMLLYTDNGLYQSSLFSTLTGIRHGVSGRRHGDVRNTQVRSELLASNGVDPTKFIGVRQVHGTHVAVVDSTYGTADTDTADAIVTNVSARTIGVRTADCVPLLFVDPKARVIAAAHAGWRGTLGGVTGNVIHAMKRLGATAKHTLSFIGPHIGACCYTVDDTRVQSFLKRFGSHTYVCQRIQDQWHLDIGTANRDMLLDEGITPDHIDGPIGCTSCQTQRYYSYRKDTSDTFGEMLSFISLDR